MASDSPTYQLFARAIRELKQIVCVYRGHRRELCPIILGHSLKGEEKALTYQFAGSSGSGLPPGGEWRCLVLSEVTEVALRDGPWHSGTSHKKRHSCVDIVDLDVNPDSPYSPKRPLRPKRKLSAKKPGNRPPRRKG
jgi:hypothetical protein